MIDNLFIVWQNKYGLSRDASLFACAEALAGAACVDVRGRSLFARLFQKKVAQRAYHFERAHRMWFSAAKEHVLIPNQEHFPERHLPRLKHISKVFAKTRHAEKIFSALGLDTSYLGFTSEDRLLGNIEKNWNRFFHLAGASVAKGTEIVLDLWEKHPEWPELILVQREKHAPAHVPANIVLLSGYLEDSMLRQLQNSCGIHLCPSRAEGWGHYIVEALSCGAVTLTTDAPPMNEHVTNECGVLVPFATTEPRHLGTYFHVNADALEAAIERLIVMPKAEKAALGMCARQRYLAIAGAFQNRIAELAVPARLQ